MDMDEKSLAWLFLYAIIAIYCCGGVTEVNATPSCKKKGERSVGSFSPSSRDVIRSGPARTEIECMLRCTSTADCASVVMDTQGTCYELSKSALDPQSQQGRQLHGTHIMMTSNVTNCSGVAHPSNGTCSNGCGNGENEPSTEKPTETCKAEDYNHFRHYWSSRSEDGADIGTVMKVTYPKHVNATGLRVAIYVAVRGRGGSPNKCSRWYVAFDGVECTNPDTIEYLEYNLQGGDYHRAIDLDGTCYGLKEGNRLIELMTSPCPGYAVTDSLTGYQSARTMYIMEVSQPNAKEGSSCEQLATFNYQYLTWKERVEETFNTTSDVRKLIKSVDFMKTISNSSLRIKYSGIMSVIASESAKRYCGRWFFTVDGDECSPRADAVIILNSTNIYSLWRNHSKVMTIEGVCSNELPAGNHSIGIYVGGCIKPFDQPTHFVSGGFDSPSRMHIEEVHLNYGVDVSLSNASMTAYFSHYHFYDASDDTDIGIIFSVTYDKQFADTGLRLTASGNHMMYYQAGFHQCARWYFAVDSQECTTPGIIDGITYYKYSVEYYTPMQVSGMCHEVGSGNVTITYNVGKCPSYGLGSEVKTGVGSAFHIFVEELRSDLVKVCKVGFPVDCQGP